jgi:hypothetical protein
MALLADRVHVGAPQQMGIRAAMRNVTRRAALGFYHGVFKDKRPGNCGMAICTEGIVTVESPWTLL